MAEQDPQELNGLQPGDENKKPIRILYAEDTEVIRNIMAQTLEIYGYTVATAKNGQEGVEMALQWEPDLILMDLRMPVMDGYQAIQAIKVNPKTRHIPVFVISAWSSKREQDQAKAAGADAFFVKPTEMKRLDEAIKAAVTASTSAPKLF
ncbi:MAG: response regulator [Anaerolineae bacterium]|nr:response regulator [Anaerolineae bacterium]